MIDDEFGRGLLIGVCGWILIVVLMMAFPCGEAEPLCQRARAFMCSGPK